MTRRHYLRSLRGGSVNIDFEIRAGGPVSPFPPVGGAAVPRIRMSGAVEVVVAQLRR